MAVTSSRQEVFDHFLLTGVILPTDRTFHESIVRRLRNRITPDYAAFARDWELKYEKAFT